MKQKLYNYLKARGGSAPSVAIVAQLMNLRGARRDVAEKIVRGWVRDDPAFLSDGLGNWFINPECAPGARPIAETPFHLVVIRGEGADLAHSRFLRMGRVRVQDGRLHEPVVDYTHRQGHPNPPDVSAEYRPLAEVLKSWLGDLEDGVLTAFQPAPVRKFLTDAARQAFGVSPEFWELSLKSLARQCYPEASMRRPADLAAALDLRFVSEDADLATYLESLANLFLALLDRLREQGVITLERLLEFQLPRTQRVNFDRLRIDRGFLAQLPEAPGVYVMRDRQGTVLYVGKARNLKRRVGSYFLGRERPEPKLGRIWNQVYDVRVTELGSELEACVEEQKLIEELGPTINIQTSLRLRDAPAEEANVVVIVPAKQSGRLRLFCVNDARRSAILEVRRGKPMTKAARQTLRKLFVPKRTTRPDTEEEKQSEVILRWLRANRDRVNWIDVDRLADLEDLLRIIGEYQTRPESVEERVIYR